MEYLKRPAVDLREADLRSVSETVTTIIADVRANGMEAVRDYAERFDGYAPEDFRVSDEEIAHAESEVPEDLKRSIHFAHDQVRRFAELQLATLQDLEVETESGVVLGHRHIPVERVGAYVPGGRYSLIASTFMSIIPAKVAGVKEIHVCTPPRAGKIHPGLLYSAHRAGADSIHAVGGVQALAAMAYGVLPGIEAVDVLVGPGNRFVVEGKRQLFGQVGVDLLAGPTEICILADDTADPYIVACDLVGQAEHDPYSRAVLITTSREVAEAVIAQMDEHLSAVSTEDVARQCWENGGEVIVVADEDELVTVSDDYAIEHVEVLVRDPDRFIKRLADYGSLFVGEEATVAYGDKVSGPNHILPTHRAARFTGGLWVGKYLKTVTYQRMDRAGSLLMAPHCETISLAEGMEAHARTASVRLRRYQTGQAS
jgi:sulfopropanediol 3-dehydrogenase